MKKLFLFPIYAPLLGMLLMVLGCSKDYLDLAPPDALTKEKVFLSTKNAIAALNGIHRSLYSAWYSTQSAGGQSSNMIYNDALGEDFVMTANANNWFITEYAWVDHRNENSAMCRIPYGFYYTIISNANAIIENIDNAEGPDKEKNLIKGGALGYRAWAYSQLVQLYGERFDKAKANAGLGVSLVLLASETKPLPRNTVAEVYTQINRDLDSSLLLLNGLTRPAKSYMNTNVVKGLKARVALAQQNWELAAKMAKEARVGFTLMSNAQYLEGFSNTENPEWIWGIDHRDDQTTYFSSFYAYLGNFSSTNSRGNPKAIFSKLYKEISQTDIRKKLWDSTGKDTNFPLVEKGSRKPYMTRKFMLQNPGNSNGDLVFMRAAEMYLTEAEAQARLNNNTEAQKVLFELAKNRDANYTITEKTSEDLISEILVQRRIELWGEGFRFTDLKRLNLPLDRRGGNHDATLAGKLEEPAGTKLWQFLIPVNELNYTRNIVVQNPL